MEKMLPKIALLLADTSASSFTVCGSKFKSSFISYFQFLVCSFESDAAPHNNKYLRSQGLSLLQTLL